MRRVRERRLEVKEFSSRTEGGLAAETMMKMKRICGRKLMEDTALVRGIRVDEGDFFKLRRLNHSFWTMTSFELETKVMSLMLIVKRTTGGRSWEG